MPDPTVKYPVTNPAEMEAAVKDAVARGILLDKRAAMPRGKDPYGNVKQWVIRYITDILGVCCHQNAGNDHDPIATAKFLTSPNNSVSQEPLPSVAYHFMIPNTADPPWYTADVTWKTWAQGSSVPGDENLALVAVCTMGTFYAPGYKPPSGKPGPTPEQADKLHKLWDWLKACFGCGDNALFGHFDFHKAACPGTVIHDWIMGLRDTAPRLETDKEWQQALLKWNPNCLPKYGADGKWGNESKSALCLFQRSNRLDCTGYQDNFSHLKLYRILYPNGKPMVPTADYHAEVVPGGIMLKRDSATCPGFPEEKFVPLPPPAGSHLLPKDILLAAAALAAEPPMFCDKCGGDLVDGKCPECAVPDPIPSAPTAPNPKAKKKG